MKKSLLLLLLLGSCLAMTSCEKNDVKPNTNATITGDVKTIIGGF